MQVVLRLAADGECELSESLATLDDFLAIKAAWEAVRNVKAAAELAEDLGGR